MRLPCHHQVRSGHLSQVCRLELTCWRLGIRAGESDGQRGDAGGSGGNLEHVSTHGQAEGSWGFGGGFGLAHCLGQRGRGEATPWGVPAQGVMALKANTVALQ